MVLLGTARTTVAPVDLDLPTLGACCRALAATPRRLAQPRRPDHQLLTSLTVADPPPARRSVKLTPLVQAHRTSPTMVVAEGVFQPLRLTLAMTSFLVEHPHARFLVDPALCADVHESVLPHFRTPFRQLVTPARPVTGLPELLERAGTAPDQVDFALPTHLHWDHISGLKELDDHLPVRTLAAEETYALHEDQRGVARHLLQDRSLEHYELDGPPVLTFTSSHDVFDDGSVILVDLHGHTPGSVGVLLTLTDDRRILLAGDAAWHSMQIKLLREKAPMPGDLVDTDRDATFTTLHRLHALPHTIDVIPSHDHSAITTFRRQKS